MVIYYHGWFRFLYVYLGLKFNIWDQSIYHFSMTKDKDIKKKKKQFEVNMELQSCFFT